jgi:hypothetical protein
MPLAADSHASAGTPSYRALATQYVDETWARVSVDLDPNQLLANEFVTEMIARIASQL